jgi:sugar phosphate isomerase/epimerase
MARPPPPIERTTGIRLAMLNWMRPEPLATTLERLARCGVDAVELSAEPDADDARTVRDLLARYGIACSAVVARTFGRRDLAHPDRAVRAGALDYVRAALDLGAALGAGSLTLVPAAIGRTEPLAGRTDEWRWAAESVTAAAEHGRAAGVIVAIEPLTREETHLVNRVDQALALADEAGDGCGVCLDVHHARIEERGVGEAIRAAGARLANVHVADDGRLPPGEGGFDWRTLCDELDAVGYRGHLSLEFVVGDVGAEEYERRTCAAAAHLRREAAAR